MVVSGCRCRPFPPDFARNTPAAGVLSFPYCPNMETNALIFASSLSFRPLSGSDLTISAGFGCFIGGGCRLPDGQGMEPGHPPPLPVAVCPLFGPEHRPPGDSPSLPSPPLFSSGQCFPLVVSVLLRCSSASGVLLGSLAFVSVLLGMVVYGGIFFFIQPRPELTRAHAGGLFLLFPASLPSAGLLVAFFWGVGVGAFLQRSESVAGRFCSISIFPVALSKIRTGIKLAPLGRFWFRPGGAGLGFFGCLFRVRW